MKEYVGVRGHEGLRVFVEEETMRYPLFHVAHHSPTGFEAGYGGSGPADLALSILADYFGERPSRKQLYHGEPRCWKFHQGFKWAFVAKFPRDKEWRLPADEIRVWLFTQPVR